jgi:hypothetical protein
MFRSDVPRIALSLTLLIAPWVGGAVELDEGGYSPLPPISEEGGAQGEVSVDLNESTPGLTAEVYRATLGSHGDWYASPRYGEVWRPRVAAGWRPYYSGTWLWTDEGWYWDSDEPFAWAVYHYGRWVYDPSWGWVWIPGYQWAPAWVAWRYGPDAVGWAPLGPGVSVFVTSYPFVDIWWTFVPTTRFVGVPVHTVAYPPRETPRYFRATSPAPPRTTPRRDGRSVTAAAPAWGGPSRRAVEERIGRPIEATRRPSSWGAGGREERVGSPGWTPPSRGVERERPGVLSVPRREEPGRPAVRPVPRGEGDRRPTLAPEPRSDGERRREAPAPRGSGEPRRQRNGWGRQ